MLKIKYKFKVSLLLILLIIFNSIYIDAAPVSEIWDNGNVAPTIDLNVTPVKKPVDIVILTDYTGTKLTALNTQINALKAQFSSVNVDPKFHIVSDVKKIGVQNDQLHVFRRYGRYHAKIDYYHENDEATDKNRWFEEIEEWEKTEGLKSQRESLPVRNPKNVTFEKSSLQDRYTDRSYLSWYDITIRCTNDPAKTSGTVRFEMTYDNWYSGTYRDKQKIIEEYAEVDSKWTMEEKISDVTFDIYSLDFNKLNTISLRADSDRHMIFLSDASAKDYSKSKGNYFSFGDMTDTLKNYIMDNNFSLYGVTPNDTRYMTLLPDKVLNILPLGSTALFYTIDGDVLKLGKYGLEETEDIGTIKDKSILTNGLSNTKHLLMEDGTIKYYNNAEYKYITVEGITNAVKMFNLGSLSYVLDGNGKMFIVDNNTVHAYNTSVVISDIIFIKNQIIYINASGVPYVEYIRYDTQLKKSTYFLTRLKILSEDEVTVRNMPAVKDAESFIATSALGELQPMLFLYKTGQIQQFLRFTTIVSYSGTNDRYKNYTPHIIEDTQHSILETNVDSIESNSTCVFIYKKDGTVKMLNTDWEEKTGWDNDDHKVTCPYPYLKNITIDVPLTNIKKTCKTQDDLYFLTDIDNHTYMYEGTYQAFPAVIGTTLKDMGSDIKKISITNISIYKFIFILYNNGTIRQIKYYNKPVSYTNTMLPYNNIKDIYVSYNNVYLLTDDYCVLRKSSPSGGFVDPFTSSLDFDTTKTYLSLLDIFNEAVSGVFYSKGAYATAFSAIYKIYEDYSSSGEKYVLWGDDIKYESAYDDYESDPEYSRKWRISHDSAYYDNSMGLSQYHNPIGFTTNPPVKLDKVGKYVINLKARDNPKNNIKFLNDTNEDYNYYKWSLGDQNLTVYIHRKPIALQRVSVTNNYNGTFTLKAFDAGSYDPDHSNSREDKGITAREWRWKGETSTAWTSGQMNKSDCTPDESYITQLRVKDVEGVWSDYNTITIDKSNPPVALFNIDKTLISTSESLKVKDMSFPQSFSTITDWHWIVKKLNSDGSVPSSNIQNAKFTNSNTGTGALAGYDKNVKYSYSSTGTYRIYLRVKDSNGLWSDGAGDSLTPVDLSKYYSMDIKVDSPPAASFTIEKNPIYAENTLQLRDTSAATGISPVSRWHWIVKKLNADGSVPAADIQDAQFTDSNTGTGSMAGYDVNVKTNYADRGPGTYRIYLRVMNGNGMWSDGGTDSAYNLNSFFCEDLVVQESYKMSNFRVVRIRDLHLEPYYEHDGEYIDRPFYVNSMAIDQTNFMSGGYSVVPGFSSLTKGYRFEFEIDTTNFNEANDTIEIEPAFFPYHSGVPGVRGPQCDLYWGDSNKEVHKAGEGGHSSWAGIVLDESNRTIMGENEATWRGEYFIPATSWLVPSDTPPNDAKSKKLDEDIIVNFTIRGYRDGEMKYDYNLQQWPLERTTLKSPYEIGDVIRYDHTKSCLEDIEIIINRP